MLTTSSYLNQITKPYKTKLQAKLPLESTSHLFINVPQRGVDAIPRVNAFNAKLGPRVELLKKSGAHAQIFDAQSWFADALAHPETLGLKNVTGYAYSYVRSL
jgi:hypothetical protein